jgi:erythromycin esterase-like protein
MTSTRVTGAEHVAARVIRWTAFYTAGLPAGIRSERLDEVRSDLHEQMVSDPGARKGDRGIARSMRARAIRGMLADVSWRRAEVRRLPRRRARIATRVVIAVVIAASAATSAVLFAGSGSDSANESIATVQVGSLNDQVHGEALFLVPLNLSLAQDLRDVGSDPNYTGYFAQQKEGALEEYNNLRVLLAQLGSEQRHAAQAAEDADQRSTEAVWLTSFTAAAFALFVFVLWFEPRLPRGSDSPRGPTAKS